MPEAQANFDRLLKAIRPCAIRGTDGLPCCSGSRALTGRVSKKFGTTGLQAKFASIRSTQRRKLLGKGPCMLLIGRSCFDSWSGWSEVGLATAGTATEQLVGLGIPALSLPGPGPQFKASFARRQSRLLGGSVEPCSSPIALATALERLLADADLRRRLGQIGQRRMGASGGSDRLAKLILDHLH
jgi:uncharacterized protein (TIGR03492 family)